MSRNPGEFSLDETVAGEAQALLLQHPGREAKESSGEAQLGLS